MKPYKWEPTSPDHVEWANPCLVCHVGSGEPCVGMPGRHRRHFFVHVRWSMDGPKVGTHLGR